MGLLFFLERFLYKSINGRLIFGKHLWVSEIQISSEWIFGTLPLTFFELKNKCKQFERKIPSFPKIILMSFLFSFVEFHLTFFLLCSDAQVPAASSFILLFPKIPKLSLLQTILGNKKVSNGPEIYYLSFSFGSFYSLKGGLSTGITVYGQFFRPNPTRK